jgi:hypothetical protein
VENNADRLRIAADILQERGIAIDERQLAALLGLMVRAVLWVKFSQGHDNRVYVEAVVAEDSTQVDAALMRGGSTLADWFSHGWKIAPGFTASCAEKSYTILILEKALG